MTPETSLLSGPMMVNALSITQDGCVTSQTIITAPVVGARTDTWTTDSIGGATGWQSGTR